MKKKEFLVKATAIAMLATSISWLNMPLKVMADTNLSNESAREHSEVALANAEDDFNIENGVLVKYTGRSQEVVVPNGVTSIGEMAFSNNTSITSVVIPEGVTSIESRAFSTCWNLANVTLPKTLTNIESNAFYGCSLTSVAIPEGVTRIDSQAFYKCKNLANVNIPTSVEYIGSGAFSETPIIKDSNNWKNGIFSIDHWIIDAKSTISGNYEIPEGTLGIGNYAFSSCKNLTSVTLPKTLKTVGDNAFFNCINLKKLTVFNPSTAFGEYSYGFYEYGAFHNDGKGTESYPADIYGYSGSTAEAYANEWNIGEGKFCPAQLTFIDLERPTSTTSIDLKGPEGNLTVGDTFQLTPQFTPDDVNNKQAVWISSDTSVAMVSSEGLVTAIKAGTATITIKLTDSSLEKSITIEVQNKKATASIPSRGSASTRPSNSSSSSTNNTVISSNTNDGILTGTWKVDSRGWWFQTVNGYPRSRWGLINGAWYYFGNDGYMRTGWIQSNGAWYYLNRNSSEGVEGAMRTGWLYDQSLGSWFYLDRNGAMATGWIQVNGTWYYLNPISNGTRGAMAVNTWIGNYFVGPDGAWIPNRTR